MAKKKIIVLVGSAAAGKTTLTARLSGRLGIPCFTEDVDGNPLLTEWYREPAKWNYWIQLFFHSRRVVSQYQAERTGGILERGLYEDLLFYDLAMETVTAEEERLLMELYRREMAAILNLYPPPDYLLYLKVSLETQKARMTQRNREAEFLLGESFYRALNAKYEEYFGPSGKYKPTATIDTDELTLDEVEDQIFKHLKGF